MNTIVKIEFNNIAILSHMQSARIQVITLTSDFAAVQLDATYLASGVTKSFENGGNL